MLEEQYHAAAAKILDDVLAEHLTTYGFASKDLIDSYMDEPVRERFKNLDHIKAGSPF